MKRTTQFQVQEYKGFSSFVGSSLCRGVCSAGGWGRSGCVSFQTSHLSSVLLRRFILPLPKLLLSPLAILLSPHSNNLVALLSSPQSPLCWTHVLAHPHHPALSIPPHHLLPVSLDFFLLFTDQG